MNQLVEMIRNSVEAGGRDRFECTREEWDVLLAVGREYGWQSRGTGYGAKSGEKLPDAIGIHDYTPGDSRDRKHVDEEDAQSWALALTAARVVRTSATIPLNATLRLLNLALLDEFIEYAHGGAFGFALGK